MPLTRPKQIPVGNLSGQTGSVIQVKSTTITAKVTATGTNSNSGVGADMGLNVTITPKRTGSHFLIQCHVGIAATTSGNTYAAILSRVDQELVWVILYLQN